MNSIGVVTVTFNSAHVLKDFLDSMAKQTHTNYILYVIDNASDDDTAKIISEVDDARIVYIQNDKNLGVAAGNNQGIVKAIEDGCESILLLNNDTLFETTLFEKMARTLEIHQADIIVPKMYYFDKKNILWFAGGEFDNIFQCDVSHAGFREEDNGQYDRIQTITYAPTCCMLITKQTIEDVGLMDEKYFVYEDDVDFCYRATHIMKKKMIYFPDVTFYHKVGGLTNKEGSSFKSDFAIRMMTRNKVYRCKKYFSFSKAVYLLLMLFRENLKIILQRHYKRSYKSFILMNLSFIKGMFY
ncbi:glycosyltransferase family 2 protein [Sulfuricurvum sp.]|uniref:glycosyltransferase family 2 protein n=1 Tax=Sulfuricurvum sp. TaxID=2025608 RepID=UPI00261E9E8F|nr:glycosyltransferase family 2 protein [Sulfuricurvum sp.]MDD4950728.1 glycosyltransferase family 2 protein [Sulfuricurvum sp.]